jgi:hypothetical protein
MALESSITGAIIAYLNALPGCICEKVDGDCRASGRPDINGCYRGRSFRIETKTPDNRNVATKKQVYNLKKWFQAGAVVMVAYSVTFVKQIFSDPWFWAYSEYEAHKERGERNGCLSWASAGALKNREEHTKDEHKTEE